MLNKNDIFEAGKQAVARVQYKPGITFRIEDDDQEMCIVMTAKREDSENPGTFTTIYGRRSLPYMMFQVTGEAVKRERVMARIIEQVHELASESEQHEADEWFKVDGVKVYDPHKDQEKKDYESMTKKLALQRILSEMKGA
jgi:hypothetical protein